MRQIIVLTLASVLVAQTGFAASPIGNVGSASVNAGEFATEQRVGFLRDDKSRSKDQRFQMRQHFDYGVNDWYALRFNIAQDRLNGENLDISSYAVENRFQLIEARDHGFDAGFRFSYVHRSDDSSPDEIDVRLVATGYLDKQKQWAWRHNTVMEHDIGSNSRGGLLFEWRHQLVREIDHGVQVSANGRWGRKCSMISVALISNQVLSAKTIKLALLPKLASIMAYMRRLATDMESQTVLPTIFSNSLLARNFSRISPKIRVI